MKRCHQCRRTYDDAAVVCAYDDSPLLNTITNIDSNAETLKPTSASKRGIATDGGEKSQPSFAEELDRKVRFKALYKRWRFTDGVKAAKEQVSELFHDLHRRADEENRNIKEYRFDFEQQSMTHCVLSLNLMRRDQEFPLLDFGGFSLVIDWVAKYENTLDDAYLAIKLYKSNYDSLDGHRILIERNRVYSAEYNFDMNEKQEVGWVQQNIKYQFVSTATLGQRCFDYLLSELQKAINDNS